MPDKFNGTVLRFIAKTSPEERASYDARYGQAKRLHWKIFDEVEAATGHEAEKRKRQGILGLLYAKAP